MNIEMQRKYSAEVERLDGELAHYDRLWGQVPQFAWAALLTPVAGYVWGWGAAFVALLVSAALVGVRAYLIAMRKSDLTWNRTRLLEDMEEGRSAPREAVAQSSAQAHAA